MSLDISIRMPYTPIFGCLHFNLNIECIMEGGGGSKNEDFVKIILFFPFFLKQSTSIIQQGIIGLSSMVAPIGLF